MYRLILFCCLLKSAFSTGTEISHKHQKMPTSAFSKCLLETGADISLPSNDTWWYDTQAYHLIMLRHPIAVAYAESKSQVQDLVRCASKHKIKISPRSGGASYMAFGSEDENLVIDVSRINSVTINEIQLEDGTRTATVGAGVRLGVLYYELGRQQTAFPAGFCPIIGLGGHVGAGGLGYLARHWGLAADNVLELEVVTSLGNIIVANNKTNVDLFFALRGGGGGNYGIVTEMKLKIHQNPPMNTAFSVTWDQPIPIADLSKAWFKWKPWYSMPPEISFTFVIGNMSSINGIYLGEDGHEGLERLLNGSGLLELGPKGSQKYEYYSSTDLLEVRAWLDNGGVHYGNDTDYEVYNVPPSFIFNPLNLPSYPTPVHPAWAQIQNDPRVNETHLDEGNIFSKGPIPNLKPHLFDRYYTRVFSQLITKELDETAYKVIEKFMKLHNTQYLFYPFGGMIGAYPTDFNAYPHRNELFYMEFTIDYEQGKRHGSSGLDHQLSIEAEIMTAMEPYTSHGNYQGSVDLIWTTDPKIYMPRYYGGNVDRLVKAKAKYDPHNLFSYEQGTPTKL